MQKLTNNQSIELIKEFYPTEEEFNEAVKSGEVSDAISEIADGMVDIYYTDIEKSLPDFIEYLEEARAEGLFDTDTNIHKQIQIGQYYYYNQMLHEALEEVK